MDEFQKFKASNIKSGLTFASAESYLREWTKWVKQIKVYQIQGSKFSEAAKEVRALQEIPHKIQCGTRGISKGIPIPASP